MTGLHTNRVRGARAGVNWARLGFVRKWSTIPFPMKKEGILFISHGSRGPEAGEEIAALATRLRPKLGVPVFETAFLEINTPGIAEGIEKCRQQGVTDLFVLLNFLNAGRHVRQDIPAEIEKARARHPGLRIQVSPHLAALPSFDDFFVTLFQSLHRPAAGAPTDKEI